MSTDHWLIQAAIKHGARPAPEVADYPAFDPQRPAVATDEPSAVKWCAAALKGVCGEIRATSEGARNDVLYRKSFRIGTLVAGGYLDAQAAYDTLIDAGLACGLPTAETVRTVRNGMRDAEPVPATLQLTPQPGIPAAFTLTPAGGDGATHNHPDGDSDDAEGPEHVSWTPIDLGPVLDGTYTPPETGLLVRDDAVGLLYPGHIHWFHGESESGKSWVAQTTAARLLADGGRVLYIDHESNPGELVGRLLAMGTPAQAILDRFDYIQPETSAMREAEHYARLLAHTYTLVVVDGVTDAVGLDGISSTDNDEVAGWMRRIPKRLARHTTAAVICIDHVSKDSEGRGRFAIGGQHKLAGIDGAAYVVEPIEPLGQGMKGSLALRVAKDRPGQVRPHCGKWRKTDRTQEAARVVIDSTTPGRTVVTVGKPEVREPGEKFRPTAVMEKVSRYVEDHPNSPLSWVRKGVHSKNEVTDAAIDRLIEEGYVTREKIGPAITHVSVKCFRELGTTDFSS